MESTDRGRAATEEGVLTQFGLRWAVLAGWRDAMRLRHLPLPVESDRLLENARVKISAGCFSACEVGCDLTQLEALLTATDASSGHNWVDFWVDLLGRSMSDPEEIERILKIPAVKAHYLNCGFKDCRC